jgi:hypothetical protein
LLDLKEALLTSCEMVAYGGLLLLLPCVPAALLFDGLWTLADIVAQATLAAVAGTAILTVIAIHEGWYLEHLSGWGLTRNREEANRDAQPKRADGVAPSDRAS